MRIVKLAVVFLFLFSSVTTAQPAAEELPPLPKGPLLLTSTTPEQLTPEYWINKLPNPDEVIKTPEELEFFNQEIRSIVRDEIDVFAVPQKRSGKPVREQLELEFKTLKNRKFFGVDDQYINKSLFDTTIGPVMQVDKVPDSINVRYGAAVAAASVRALPTDVKMLEEKADYEFDQLQFTLIKLWTPVAILHTSSDGRWYYIQAPYTRGWVRSKDIAVFSGRDELKKFAKSPKFLCVTGESIPVFLGPELQTYSLKPSMGTRLPLAGVLPNAYAVLLPVRGSAGKVSFVKGYVDKRSDVSVGYLPYTQRNIIRQAFKLLGARYGWGGMYNGRDCSGFTHDVFLSLGLDMPRNSKGQGYVGTQLGHFTPYADGDAKVEALKIARPGLTLLRMPMHLMIYLGQDRGHFWVIHSTWAERYDMNSDAKNRINQVVVSDLTLNGKSYLGSLFHRIISINEVN